MTKTLLFKTKSLVFVLMLLSIYAYSQTCQVDRESLKGTYTGDCKKDKAHGKGKAVGTDTYEGDFKNGVPDGQGTYIWSNKSSFTGKYVKGLREGKGAMTFKSAGGQDSVVEGFWKKDVYIGKNEKPYQIYSKTGSVRNVEVEYTPDNVSRVKVIITNTTGGVASLGGQLPQARVDNVIIVKGNFQRQTTLENHFKSTETSLFEITFPFRIKLQIGREEVELEMFEAGSYTINIAINN
jgi:hypothetical protein